MPQLREAQSARVGRAHRHARAALARTKRQRALVICGRVNVEVQTRIVNVATRRLFRQASQKFPEGGARGVSQAQERFFRQDDRMTQATGATGLADARRLLRTERQQCLQGFRPQVWLVTQRNCPVPQSRHPARPPRGAANRAEHSQLGLWIENPVAGRELQVVQSGSHPGVRRGADHCYLAGTQCLPHAD